MSMGRSVGSVLFKTIIGVCSLLGKVSVLSAQQPTSAGSGTAATSPTEAATQPADATTKPVDAVTVESINAKIKAIQEQQGLDDAIKNSTVEIYNQALGDLARASEYAAKSAEILKQRDEAPGTVEQINELAAKPIPDTKIEPPPPDAKLEDLEKQLKQYEADFTTASDRQKVLESQLADNKERAKTIPKDIAEARKLLDNQTNALVGTSAVEEPPEQAAARRVSRLAKGKALERQLETLNLEQDRTGLLEALAKNATRDTAIAEKVFKTWQDIVNEKRRAVAEAAAAKAKTVEEEAKQSHPIVAKLATENANLAKERTEVTEKIAQVEARLTQIDQEYATIIDRQKKIRERVQKAGLSPQLALLLRRYREQLPDVRALRGKLGQRREDLANVEVRQFELGELIQSDEDRKAEIRERMAALPPSTAKEERSRIKGEIRELLILRQDTAVALKADYDKYFDQLGEVDKGLVDRQEALLSAAEKFAAYVNEHILWIRSTKPPQFGKGEGENDIENFFEALAWLFKVDHWKKAGEGLWKTIQDNPVESVLGMLFFLVCFSLLWKLRSALAKAGQTVSKSYTPVFTPTAESLVITIVIAALGPALLGTFGWLMGVPYNAPEFAKAVSSGFVIVAIQWFGIAVLRQACLPRGLLEAHFNWPSRIVKRIRRYCTLLLAIGMPCVFVAAAMDWVGRDTWQRSLGRSGFVVAEVLLAIFLFRVLHPVDGALAETNLLEKPGWKRRFARLGYYAAIALPIGLSVLALMGYYYTAIEIAIRFQRMMWLSTGVVLLYGLGLRWLLVSRRKLAIAQARQRRAAREAEHLAEAEAEGSDATPESRLETPPEPEIDLSSLNVQTRAILRGVSVVAFAVGLWLVWVDVVPALRYFDRFELWSTLKTVTETTKDANGAEVLQSVERSVPVTLGDLGVSLLIIVAAMLAIRNLPGVLEIGILRRTGLGAGERYAIVTISKYIIMVLSLMGAFNSIGVGWAQVQFLAAAITVGLGFGLQEIFANFVSGLIILFERPIRVGDVVTVGGVDGRVTRIQMRATTVMNWDRKELIIPNKEFVTGQVINWTLSDEIMRIQLPIGIAYGSETRLARDLILKVSKENPRVMNDPEPRVIFTGFGASSLDFELRCYVKDMDDFVTVKDVLHYEIDDVFRKANIEIAFPQMDLHLRDVPSDMARVDGEPRHVG